MENTGLDKPIFIIAGVRSGTTMIGDILSKHEDLAYWIEPKYIWKYRKPFGKNDLRSASEATKSVSQYIQRRFTAFTKSQKKSRFLEKTPSNVFRVSFINKIFPDALFIHLIRNGISTTLSAEKKWTSRPAKSALLRRLTSREIPLIDLPFYLVPFLREVIRRYFIPQRGFVWGQQFKGIHKYRATHSILETCAKQWKEGLTAAQTDLGNIDKKRVYSIKYEDLIEHPESELKNLLQFLNLEPSPEVLSYAKTSIRKNEKIYTAEDQEKIKMIEPIISDLMHKYDYV